MHFIMGNHQAHRPHRFELPMVQLLCALVNMKYNLYMPFRLGLFPFFMLFRILCMIFFHASGNDSLAAAVSWIIDHENDPDIDQMPSV